MQQRRAMIRRGTATRGVRVALIAALLGGLVGMPATGAFAATGDEPTATPTASETADASTEATESTTAPTETAGAEDDAASTDATTESYNAVTPNAIISPMAVPTLQCGDGYFYSVRNDGTVRKINAETGTASTEGSWTGRSEVNGLGIGANGETMYAYQRSGNNVQNISTMLRWTAASGQWEAIPGSANSIGGSNGLVAGAVDLNTGLYVYGAYSTQSGTVYLNLYVYNPASNQHTYIGRANVGDTWGGNYSGYNGDFAFDSTGTLFAVRASQKNGNNIRMSIASISASQLAAAIANPPAQNAIPAATGTIHTISNAPSGVNGIAFLPDGTVMLGDGTTASKYNPSTGVKIPNTSTLTIAPSSNSSTDLASCASPATVTLLKDVAGRSDSSDQFNLTLRDSSQTGSVISTGTTSGSATGIQGVQVGPFPVQTGQVVAISESMASGSTSTLADYTSSYQCVDETGATLASGNASQGTVKIPNRGGAAVVCTITNKPLVAAIKVTKTVQDSHGENDALASGWAMTVNPTTGTLTPSATTQTTNSSGASNWKLRLGSTTATSTVTVTETQQDGYVFVSGQCVITSLDGSKSQPIVFDAESGTVPGVKAGDSVECGFVNKEQPTELTIIKAFELQYGAPAVENDWTFTAAPTSGATLNYTSGETKEVAAGTYAITELFRGGDASASGYELKSMTCEVDGTSTTITDGNVTVPENKAVTCTLVNTDKPGSVVWTKVDGNDNELGGSEWTLTGPDGTVTTITDCDADDASECTGPDRDPAPGRFSLQSLSWGTYTLVESAAPAGYLLDETEHTIVIGNGDGQQLDYDLGAITNDPRDGLEIPLTGGLGQDAFLFGGGGLLLIVGLVFGIRALRRRATS
ncbi:prealbumin-like fold domain-containing protein [Gulosibacter sp. ACHW.36C]|uniref:Prealbumin-like fold domain-containing protein n=1 Tax=Gulosibacter sediminis TaxID=1729695 RepID=A0ABY4MX92_9MICO|nr:prealbumin-like fold domain-containing protein [Gulosibacter sediminis]UQN15047.1 prealbumin-like fold domain-containing protein [Gulosibacter sediminis]